MVTGRRVNKVSAETFRRSEQEKIFSSQVEDDNVFQSCHGGLIKSCRGVIYYIPSKSLK